jgi:outer membrane protein TolC
MKPRSSRWLALTPVLLTLAVPAALRAQKSGAATATTIDYTQSRAFPNILDAYSPRLVPEPPLSNSERLRALIRNGKVYLSLQDAIVLTLENNLDIAVARYNLPLAQTDYLRTKGGGAVRGVSGAAVSSALFAGAIGGGTGGGGGAGTGGAGGLTGGGGATNTGSVSCCDPFAGVSFGWDRRTSPLNSLIVSGVPQVTTQNTSYQAFMGQGFLTGTSFVVAGTGFRQSTTSIFNLFNPEVPLGLTLGFNQHLLNGFGYRSNAGSLRIAKNDLRVADSVFRQQVMTTVSQVLNLYSDLVSFRENVAVAEKALGLAEKTLSDNKRQVEIGTLAPIEVVRAESEAAARQQDLIVAQTSYQQQQEVLKTALSKQVSGDLATVGIEATDSLPEPAANDIPPLDEALRQAIKNRPEIEQADLNLRNQAFTIQSVRNRLLPTLDVFATYAPTGLSGNQVQCGTPQNPMTCLVPGGFSQAFTQALHGRYPDYSFGLVFDVPIRNRTAQADAATAMLQERQLRTQLQQRRNQVEQDVRNAVIAVTQAKAQIEAASKAVTLAQQTLDAEQKKFQLGESTVFLVIQAQRDLATAAGNEVKARSTYAKALTQLTQATGTTLDKNGIQLAEAKDGQVSRVPNIPGTPLTPSSPAATPQP